MLLSQHKNPTTGYAAADHSAENYCQMRQGKQIQTASRKDVIQVFFFLTS